MRPVTLELVFLALAATVFSLVYTFAEFSYLIADSTLIMRWHLLGKIPWRSRRIALSGIESVRRFDRRHDLLRGGDIFGRLPSKKGVILSLSRPKLLGRHIWITPPDPDRFIAELTRHLDRC